MFIPILSGPAYPSVVKVATASPPCIFNALSARAKPHFWIFLAATLLWVPCRSHGRNTKETGLECSVSQCFSHRCCLFSLTPTSNVPRFSYKAPSSPHASGRILLTYFFSTRTSAMFTLLKVVVVAALSLVPLASGETHLVVVGEGGGLTFTPSNLTAVVGDVIEFML